MLDKQTKQRLKKGLAALPFVVSAEQEAAFLNYLVLLNQWNNVHNLTAIREPYEQVALHILDCLAVLPLLPNSTLSLADIGSGAGLPAFMLAIMRPEVCVYAVESVRKKAVFMRHASLQLGLDNVVVIDKRVENWQPQQKVDVIISRAMTNADNLLKLTSHLAGTNTLWLLMKAKETEKVQRSGFEQGKIVPITVPFLTATRHVLTIQRTENAI